MATLTLTVTSVFTSDQGTDYGTTLTSSITGVTAQTQFDKSVGTSVEDVATFGAAGSGSITTPKVIVVNNNDSTNFVIIGLKDTGGDTVYHKVPAGQTLVLNSDELEVSTSGAAFSAFSNADTLTAQADTAAVDLRVQIYGA